MVVVSSSAKHLQSQHPCERGAARVKQHFCPVRLSLALHSLQHHLIGLPFSSIKFPGCKKSTEKQKAHLGDCHQRKQLGLLQAGECAQPSHLTRAAKRHSTRIYSRVQPQRLHYKSCPESNRFVPSFATERLPKSSYLAAKTTGQQ